MMKDFWISVAIAVGATALSYIVGFQMGWVTELNWLEVFAVATSYSTTYLCVMQRRLNYPIGVVTTAAYTYLFFLGGLYSSAMLNAYLVPTLIWGWFRWGKDEVTRPVTLVSWKWWPVYIGLTGATWYGLVLLSTYMGATLPLADSAILALSILAQFLLDQKKLETWGFWAIVNVLAIPTYFYAGLPLVAFQYVLFLLNTVYGFVMWWKTYKV